MQKKMICGLPYSMATHAIFIHYNKFRKQSIHHLNPVKKYHLRKENQFVQHWCALGLSGFFFIIFIGFFFKFRQLQSHPCSRAS